MICPEKILYIRKHYDVWKNFCILGKIMTCPENFLNVRKKFYDLPPPSFKRGVNTRRDTYIRKIES